MAQQGYDWRTVLGVNYNPESFRGASPASPLLGSSNTANAMPLAGGYQSAFGLLSQPSYKTATPEEQQWLRSSFTQTTPTSSTDQVIADYLKYQMSPEARKQAIADQLEYAKAQGDQMMKYRLTNDIISNLGSAARAAFGRYSDPGAISQMMTGVANAGIEGSRASANLSQLGATIPERKYYNV